MMADGLWAGSGGERGGDASDATDYHGGAAFELPVQTCLCVDRMTLEVCVIDLHLLDSWALGEQFAATFLASFSKQSSSPRSLQDLKDFEVHRVTRVGVIIVGMLTGFVSLRGLSCASAY